MKESLKQMQERFARDRYASEGLEAVIEEAGDGFARCTMEILPRHCNALGIPMGGVLFTLADFAFAVSANQNGREVVTQTSQITFLTPARGRRLTAEARRKKDGRKTCFYEVTVKDELGTEVAFVTVSGFVVKEAAQEDNTHTAGSR